MPDIWNLNTTGFQSIVEYNSRTRLVAGVLVSDDRFATQLPADYVAANEREGLRSSHLLVRARIEADLDAMKAYDPEAIVFEDKTADYQFRMIIRREAVARFNYDVTMGVDYWSHVKEEMNARSPVAQGRMNAYYSVWTALSKIQPHPPYGAKRFTPSPIMPATTIKKSDGSAKGTDYVRPTSPVESDWFSDRDEDLFRDDPAPGMVQWELDLAACRVSSTTMSHQAEELIGEIGAQELAQVVDQLVEHFGTVDLDTVNFDEVWAIIDGENTHTAPAAKDERVNPVHSYWRTNPVSGLRHEVKSYRRNPATKNTQIGS